MREVISVHVGQAGVQIGNACCTSFISIYRRDLQSTMTRHFALYHGIFKVA